MPEVVSAQLAIAEPRRIKATHRRRLKVTAGHFVQRYYDPQIGRFLSVDPVGTNANNGDNFNRYWYADGNPFTLIDPDGRYSCEASICAEIGRYVSAIRDSRDTYKRSSADWKQANAVLAYIGTKGGEGPSYVSGELEGPAIASTDQAGNTTVDLEKIRNNPDPETEGARAIGHEGQHDIYALVNGVATTRDSVGESETSAYNTEAIIAKGLGVHLPQDKLEQARDTSVERWEKRQEDSEMSGDQP